MQALVSPNDGLPVRCRSAGISTCSGRPGSRCSGGVGETPPRHPGSESLFGSSQADPALHMSSIAQENQIVMPRIAASLFLVALVFLDYPTCASPWEFAAEGVIDYQVLSPMGTVLVEQDDLFTVSVKDCQWHIKKTPIRFLKNGRPQPVANYGIASSDSTNFYQLASFKQIVRFGPQKREAFDARIGPGAVPFGLSDPKYIVLWYAFGSGCYFSALTNDQVNPPTILKSEAMYAQDFRVVGQWDLQNQPPFLPRSIVFDAPPALETTAAGTIKSRFTNCVFTVQASTNYLGLLLPKTLTVDYFGRHPQDSTAIIPTSRMRIVVSNFLPCVGTEHFRPEITDSTVISDLRTITTNTPFGVAVRDSRNWPKIEDSKKRASRRAQAIAMTPQRNLAHATIARLVLFSVVCAPMLWWVIQQLRCRNSKSTTKQ